MHNNNLVDPHTHDDYDDDSDDDDDVPSPSHILRVTRGTFA
jgi:hypothetical protein